MVHPITLDLCPGFRTPQTSLMTTKRSSAVQGLLQPFQNSANSRTVEVAVKFWRAVFYIILKHFWVSLLLGLLGFLEELGSCLSAHIHLVQGSFYDPQSNAMFCWTNHSTLPSICVKFDPPKMGMSFCHPWFLCACFQILDDLGGWGDHVLPADFTYSLENFSGWPSVRNEGMNPHHNDA